MGGGGGLLGRIFVEKEHVDDEKGQVELTEMLQ